MAKRSNKIIRVQPLAGAAANLAGVPHEGMCRGAAANAKQGCKQLAKQTAITMSKMKTERITNSKINITPLPTCVLKAYTGQRNDVGGGNEKGPESINASRPADRSSALAWLSLVGMLARPTFGRCPAQLRFTKQRQCTRTEKRSYKLRAQKVRPLPENTTEKIVNRLLTPTALSGTWHPAHSLCGRHSGSQRGIQ